jgi:hypothetical protein
MLIDAVFVDMSSYRRLKDVVVKLQMDLTAQQPLRFPRILPPHHIVQGITQVYILKTNLTSQVSCRFCVLQLLLVAW